MNWIDAEKQVPDSERDVLIAQRVQGAFCSVINYTLGAYIPPFTLSADEYLDDRCGISPEYDSNNNAWIPEGWYITTDYVNGFKKAENVIYWMDFPKLPGEN